MGLVTDLQQSSISFSNPRRGAAIGSISNIIHLVMHSFSVTFAFRFDARQGVPPPINRELWQIGIVQNVIYEKLFFEYSDGAIFSHDFTNSVLDSAAVMYVPFYHDPVRLPENIVNPNTMQTTRVYSDFMVPVRDLWYTNVGFGELLDPWHLSSVAINNGTLSVNILDEPGFGTRLWRGRAILIRAEHIIAYQTWLMAKSPGQTHVLAHVPPFSLLFWVETQPTSHLLSTGTPPHRFGFYGQQGIVRRVSQRHRGTPNIRIQLGTGGRSPVLQGVTGNERGRQWLRTNGLLHN